MKIEKFLLAGILLTALVIRVWGVNYDLPYIYHPDEPIYITIAQGIFKTGDLNPHFFNYPSLFFYINAIAYIPYYWAGKLAGVFQMPSNIEAPLTIVMGVTRVQKPSFVLLGRMLTILFSIGTVGLTYKAGKQLTKQIFPAVIASFLMAISLGNVTNSRYITPDTYVVFFASASLLASLKVYQRGGKWDYIIAGICIGLTASSKYNGVLVILPLILAHFSRYGRAVLRHSGIYLAFLFVIMAFVFTTPFSIIDFSSFLQDITYEGHHYATGHVGMDGHSFVWYIKFMWQTGGIIYFLAFFEIIRGLISRSKEILILAIFPVVYFVFISSLAVRNDRTFLPLTPFLFVLASSFLSFGMTQIKNIPGKMLRYFSYAAIATLICLMLFYPMNVTISDTINLTQSDSREVSRKWIEDSIPAGSKIAVESYSPFVDPNKYAVKGVVQAIDYPTDWYVSNSYDYLVLSKLLYGRFFNEPTKYLKEISEYNAIFSKFILIKEFTSSNDEILIYKIK